MHRTSLEGALQVYSLNTLYLTFLFCQGVRATMCAKPYPHAHIKISIYPPIRRPLLVIHRLAWWLTIMFFYWPAVFFAATISSSKMPAWWKVKFQHNMTMPKNSLWVAPAFYLQFWWITTLEIPFPLSSLLVYSDSENDHCITEAT